MAPSRGVYIIAMAREVQLQWRRGAAPVGMLYVNVEISSELQFILKHRRLAIVWTATLVPLSVAS